MKHEDMKHEEARRAMSIVSAVGPGIGSRRRVSRGLLRACGCAAIVASWFILLLAMTGLAGAAEKEAGREEMVGKLDAPLLFVKRHSYTGIHIYDTYYKWPPGGGGIYVLENPAAPQKEWKIRAVIDGTTKGTLGNGVYTHPELSWDAKKILFCYKNEPQGSTSVYEIFIDGTGLRRLTNPEPTCNKYKGTHAGQHDIAPAYLPDGRIVLLSTRPSGLVPCANEGVSILHVMNADGSDLHPISVNNVNEFDPAVMNDGRIVFGRWEYIDKNALTIQSLWTVYPDGTNETALYANNMVLPEAILDVRPVPGSQLIVATLAKHNATPRGSVAFIDPRVGKNDPKAIANLEHPENPTFDKGDSCEPWALDENTIIYSGRPKGQKRNILMMRDRAGRAIEFMSDPEICIHSPMLVKARAVPPVLPETTDRKATTGKFFVQDIYKGLTGVKPGEVKFLRVIEETSRVSATGGGKQPYNQTFLVSAALAFSVKNFLGVVPVQADGSAYFEVPAGRAVYLQALDGEGRLIQSMRTFVQAAPGSTRSCIGCHEHKFTSPANTPALKESLARGAQKLQPESWGSGHMDFPSRVQPILDKHCVSCHGGEKGFAGGMDLTGGWTEHFNIAYENLANRKFTQLIAYWIAGIDCMNGTAYWSSQIFEPRKHGSAAAPLTKMLFEAHGGYTPNLTRTERDTVLAWIDSNGLYHGSWDYTKNGCAIRDWDGMKSELTAQMQQAGCMKCHAPGRFESDWVNLKEPQMSRLLRAPLAKGSDGLGVEMCRDRKASAERRVKLLVNGYAHAIQPIEFYAPKAGEAAPAEAGVKATFGSTQDAGYKAMLRIIRSARVRALASPRQDMPGADIIPGESRQFIRLALPDPLPQVLAKVDGDGIVRIEWERSARTIGLEAEVHRGLADGFEVTAKTLLESTIGASFVDRAAPAGKVVYAVVLVSGDQKSKAVYTSVTVPPPVAPLPPANLSAASASCAIRLSWDVPQDGIAGYNVYRLEASGDYRKLNVDPVTSPSYADTGLKPNVAQSYVVKAVSIRGLESSPSNIAKGEAIILAGPVFVATFAKDTGAEIAGAGVVAGKVTGKAKVDKGVLDLRGGGHLSWAHRGEFDLAQPISVEFWVNFEQAGKMPVLASCGEWKKAGWFVQRMGGGFRWHLAGIDCDGGKSQVGQWMHIVGTWDGKVARLFQNGKKVGEASGMPASMPFAGELNIGQYSHAGPEYQVNGRMAGVKLYHRALEEDEVLAGSKTAPK